jgi:hypothetical protein
MVTGNFALLAGLHRARSPTGISPSMSMPWPGSRNRTPWAWPSTPGRA